jgi:predicted hotdog family 3-hydroxylacyl-ACP dehydratase
VTAPAHPPTLGRDGIAERIPHAGSMCLLDALEAWDAEGLLCRASSHQDPANPLRSPQGLLAPVAIEYAAQAMALHGALTAAPGTPPRPGYLAAVRGVLLHQPRLDTAAGPLRVQARRQAAAEQQAIYSFSVADAEGRPLVEGRATVVLNTPLNLPPATSPENPT